MAQALLFALDLEAARSGISKDVEEFTSEPVGWVILIVAAALPVGSFLALITRRWLALIPFAFSAGLFAVWVLYYGTDWWSNPGQGAWMPAFAIVLLGWLVLIVALARRARAPSMDA